MSEMETVEEGIYPAVNNPSSLQEEGTEEGDKAPCDDGYVSEETEKRISDLESTAEELKTRVIEKETQIDQLQSNLEEAVTRYRAGILRDNPEIPGHLLTGSTVAELDASLEEARTVISTVKRHLEDNLEHLLQVPAGAPARSGDAVDSLSPRQKIEYGIKNSKARKGGQ